MKPTCNLLGWEAFFGFFAQFNWGIFPDLFPSSEGNSGGHKPLLLLSCLEGWSRRGDYILYSHSTLTTHLLLYTQLGSFTSSFTALITLLLCLPRSSSAVLTILLPCLLSLWLHHFCYTSVISMEHKNCLSQ